MNGMQIGLINRTTTLPLFFSISGQ